MVAPYEPSCHTLQYRHVDDIYRLRHRQYVPIFYTRHSSYYSTRALHIKHGDEQVSGHLEHPVKPALQLHSSHNRGKIAASPLRY